jgi:hypothetical protein
MGSGGAAAGPGSEAGMGSNMARRGGQGTPRMWWVGLALLASYLLGAAVAGALQ